MVLAILPTQLPAYVSDTWQSLLGFTQSNLDRILGETDQNQDQNQDQHHDQDHDQDPAKDKKLTLFTVTLRAGGQLKRRVVSVTRNGTERVIEILPESLHAREHLHRVEQKAGEALCAVNRAKDTVRDVRNRVQDTVQQAKQQTLGHARQARDEALQRAEQVRQTGTQRVLGSLERFLGFLRSHLPSVLAPPTLPELRQKLQTARKQVPARLRVLAHRLLALGCMGRSYLFSRHVTKFPQHSLGYLKHVLLSLRSPSTEWGQRAPFQTLDNELSQILQALYRLVFFWRSPSSSPPVSRPSTITPAAAAKEEQKQDVLGADFDEFLSTTTDAMKFPEQNSDSSGAKKGQEKKGEKEKEKESDRDHTMKTDDNDKEQAAVDPSQKAAPHSAGKNQTRKRRKSKAKKQF